jgi:hypothetical protein
MANHKQMIDSANSIIDSRHYLYLMDKEVIPDP